MFRFPAGCLKRLRAADGTRICLRPMQPSDVALLRWGMERLSPQSRRNRFLAAVGNLSEDVLYRLANPDPRNEVALIATRRQDSAEAPVAVARFVIASDRRSCEFAIVVGDRWHGQGLGRQLLKALIAAARARRIPRIEGQVFADNRAMLRLARSLGFMVSDCGNDPEVRMVELDLAPPASANPLLSLVLRVLGGVHR